MSSFPFDDSDNVEALRAALAFILEMENDGPTKESQLSARRQLGGIARVLDVTDAQLTRWIEDGDLPE